VDPEVFIRSLATRGQLGGLSRATADCIQVMDALGRDFVLVETVGVGQDEIDVAQLAHTTVVVLVPGLGDDIQAMKAGILEIADVYAINKADLPGADRVARELRGLLELRPADPSGWEPPIVDVVATRGEGTGALLAQVEAHRAILTRTGQLAARQRARARMQLLTLLRERLLEDSLERLERDHGPLDEVADRVARHQLDPYALVEALRGGRAP
jgi:LAO/AO transport system kinase